MVDLIVSGTTYDVPTRPEFATWAANVAVRWDWVRESTPFRGRCFVVRASRATAEPDPSATLHALTALLGPGSLDYPDTPDMAERRSRLTAAMDESQAQSIAQRDD